jgi:hypothetical protein
MADIPRVPLNIDPRGYAGRFTPAMDSSALLGGPGIPPEFMRMLAERHAMQQRIAAAQLAQMRSDLLGSREARRREDANQRLRYKGFIEEQKQARMPYEAQREANELARRLRGQRSYEMAESLYRSGTPTRAFGLEHLAGAINAISPEMASEGLRQSGALLASQGSGGAIFGPDTRYSPYSYFKGEQSPDVKGPIRPFPTQPIPTFKKGSLPGTVPKTGNYKLHKGEIVVSEPQVDEPLLNYLIGDKLRKGITDKNPKGYKTYQEGTLGYAMPSVDPALAAALGLKMYGGEDIIKGQPEHPQAEEIDLSPYAVGKSLRWGAAYPFKLLGGVGESLGELWRGVSGNEPAPSLKEAATAAAATTAAPLPMERGAALDIPPEDLAQMQARLDLARAQTRARGGDLGTRENPLVLSGSTGLGPNSATIMPPPEGRGDEDLPPEERYFAPEEPRWREAQHQKTMAALNRRKADKIQGFLLSEGMNMDPRARQDLMRQAEWLHASADMVEEREQAERERREELGTRAQAAIIAARTEIQKAQASGDELSEERAQKHRDTLQDRWDDLAMKYVDTESDSARERLINVMARVRMEQAELDRRRIPVEAALISVRHELGELSEEEAMEELRALEGE